MRKDGPISPPFWLDADSTGVWYHCALSLPPPSSSKARGTLRLVVRSFVADKNAFPPPLLSPCIMACHARTRRPWKEKTGADTGAAGVLLAVGSRGPLNKERKASAHLCPSCLERNRRAYGTENPFSAPKSCSVPSALH